MVDEKLVLWRGALIVAGVGLLGFGAVLVLLEVDPATYPGVAFWLAGAIVLHDGVAAVGVFIATVLVRRADRVPFVVRAIVQGAAVVALIVTVLVVPEIVALAIGPANPSVLPLDYAGNLLAFHAGLVAATVVAIVIALALRRRTAQTAARTR
ncbi:MAG: hypothetical protein ACSLFA_15375 [Mycobacterium sp.]